MLRYLSLSLNGFTYCENSCVGYCELLRFRIIVMPSFPPEFISEYIDIYWIASCELLLNSLSFTDLIDTVYTNPSKKNNATHRATVYGIFIFLYFIGYSDIKSSCTKNPIKRSNYVLSPNNTIKDLAQEFDVRFVDVFRAHIISDTRVI